jgi:hypothetical protein
MPIQRHNSFYSSLRYPSLLTVLLPNTLYAPALRHLLIYGSALSSSALHTYFAGHSCSIYDVSTPLSPVLVARSTHHEGLYFMSNPDVAFSSVPIPMPTPGRDIPSPAALNVCLRSRTSSPNRDIDTWNSLLGHTGTENIVLYPVPVSMRDMFLFRHAGRFYQRVALPFGWGRSPMWFTRLLRPVVQHLRTNEHYRVLAYLDDFPVAPSPAGKVAGSSACRAATGRIDKLLQHLGLVRHPSKGEWVGSTRVEHLGVVIDTEL